MKFGRKEPHQVQIIVHVNDETKSRQINCLLSGAEYGNTLLRRICDQLGLTEKDYCGLYFADYRKQWQWLDVLKTLGHQFKQLPTPVQLTFKFKFYPPDPLHLKSPYTRFLLYRQLRVDLEHRRLVPPLGEPLARLCGYIAQVEFGDWDSSLAPDYLSSLSIPHLPAERTRQIHKSLAGLDQAEAESQFLAECSSLPQYGIIPHHCKDQQGSEITVGINHEGVATFLGQKRTHIFSWNSVYKISFESRTLIIGVNANQRKHLYGFKCTSRESAKHLWKCAVEQKAFFTLPSSQNIPKPRVRIGVFQRGSSFRYAGRVQKEVLAEKTDPESRVFHGANSFTLPRSRPFLAESDMTRAVSEMTMQTSATTIAGEVEDFTSVAGSDTEEENEGSEHSLQTVHEDAPVTFHEVPVSSPVSPVFSTPPPVQVEKKVEFSQNHTATSPHSTSHDSDRRRTAPFSQSRLFWFLLSLLLVFSLVVFISCVTDLPRQLLPPVQYQTMKHWTKSIQQQFRR